MKQIKAALALNPRFTLRRYRAGVQSELHEQIGDDVLTL
jgi:hypothetical protein